MAKIEDSWMSGSKTTDMNALMAALNKQTSTQMVKIKEVMKEKQIEERKITEDMRKIEQQQTIEQQSLITSLAVAEFERGKNIPTTRSILQEVIDWAHSLYFQEDALQEFAEMRQISPLALKKNGGFYIPEDWYVEDIPEKFRNPLYGLTTYYKGNKVLYFRGRWVFIVRDVYGQPMGFCGYDRDSTFKYKDSENYGYKAKRGNGFGMEDLPQYYKDGYCVFVEGPMCKIRGYEVGLNVIALFGSTLDSYMASVIRRFGKNAVLLTDDDAAGEKFRKTAMAQCPEALLVSSHVAKDLDDSVKVVGRDFAVDIINLLNDRMYQPKYLNTYQNTTQIALKGVGYGWK